MIGVLLIVAFHLSGLLSIESRSSVPRESILSFDSTPAQGVEKGQPELGACILDACAGNPMCGHQKAGYSSPLFMGWKLAPGGGECPAAKPPKSHGNTMS